MGTIHCFKVTQNVTIIFPKIEVFISASRQYEYPVNAAIRLQSESESDWLNREHAEFSDLAHGQWHPSMMSQVAIKI